MNTYLGLFMIALCSSLVLTPIVRRMCERFGWLDEPRDDRRVHHRALPRLGGLAIFASALISLSTLLLVDNLVTHSLRANSSQFFMMLVPATLVLLLGMYDDVRGADARLKFLVLAAAGALLYAMGGRVEALSIPFIGSVQLPTALGLAVTILWVVGVTNAFNLIDGVDGLAAGAALFASIVMLVVSLMLNHPLVTVVAIVLTGALIGFLRYNINPASVFLGDTGSLFIGFTLAALSLLGSQKASTAVAVVIPLMTFALPVIDTGFTVARRFLSGRPIFQGDREHIHHMLLARGLSQRQAVFVLYGVCALFGLMALLFVNDNGRVPGLILLVVCAAVLFAFSRLRYHEVDEVRASMKRNLAERRLRAANHIRIRRASRSISKADSLGELFGAVQHVLESGEFVFATVQIGCRDAALNEMILAREEKERALRRAELRGGFICWRWERGDIEATEVVGSGRFWTLRLPLSTEESDWGYINFYRSFAGDALLLDINYLSSLFQREMARAAERIFKAAQRVEPEALPLTASATAGQ